MAAITSESFATTIRESYHDICEIVVQASEREKGNEQENLKQEVSNVVLAIVARVVNADNRLSAGESALLNSLITRNEAPQEHLHFLQEQFSRWPSFSTQAPQFLDLVLHDDAKQNSRNARLILSYLQIIANTAGICDGSFSGKEKRVVVEYLNFLDNHCDKYETGNCPAKIAKAKTDVKKTVEETYEALIEQLEKQVGLETVKQEVKGLVNLLRVRRLRQERGLPFPPVSLHLVFTGNPGTGKTTIARLLSKIYRSIGLLSNGHLIETDRSGLVGAFLGQTAIKTKDLATKALGGVLFVDEAYSLSSSRQGDDYGKEAIDTLLKFMEDHRDDFVLIVAGYPSPMGTFLESNPGLKSRFNKFIEFEDYSPKELYDIFVFFCAQVSYTFNEECGQLALSIFQAHHQKRDKNFGNGRLVRNIFETAIVNQANRLAEIPEPSQEDLQTLIAPDLPIHS